MGWSCPRQSHGKFGSWNSHLSPLPLLYTLILEWQSHGKFVSWNSHLSPLPYFDIRGIESTVFSWTKVHRDFSIKFINILQTSVTVSTLLVYMTKCSALHLVVLTEVAVCWVSSRTALRMRQSWQIRRFLNTPKYHQTSAHWQQKCPIVYHPSNLKTLLQDCTTLSEVHKHCWLDALPGRTSVGSSGN